MECGFCEKSCPSQGFTLSPRQRITVQRELARMQDSEIDIAKQTFLTREYKHFGDATCVGDGMCAQSCPLEIDTGKFIKAIREQDRNWYKTMILKFIGQKFALCQKTFIHLAPLLGAFLGLLRFSKFKKKLM